MLSFLFTKLSSLSTGGGPVVIGALGPAVKYPAETGVAAVSHRKCRFLQLYKIRKRMKNATF